MSESRYRDEDAERQAGKILQRIANTWGRDGAQWLLDRFQARSPYVRDGIAWAARQNGVGEPAGDRQTSRPPSQAGQAQEAAYQAESLYDSQADRSHWREVMREADHLAHEYTAADRNQDADAFQDAIDNAQAFVRRHGLADADRTPWYKFKGAAQMDDWMTFRETGHQHRHRIHERDPAVRLRPRARRPGWHRIHRPERDKGVRAPHS
ncbi:hypothetical protein [Nonomuraea aurantiaca]|uniref:hypothetical protein n=1 Tax=Nonomuraea aurantiaca TaxID=2878562 RepID=UPI001CD9FFCE|nr:hypothetical protein [Nonomuraea aurantiaca]MCA2229737.1 hypothetical protein [Nonomuraea aurantiaca]